MKISRNLAIKFHFILDQFVPPILRDVKWFMAIPLRLLFKDKASLFLNFKEKAFYMTEAEQAQAYEAVQSVLIERETDLNKNCVTEIMQNVAGENVLEVGCGRGFLSHQLSQKYRLTAVDIAISQETKKQYPSISFIDGNIERLPFKDRFFDTVVCAHTLEHIPNVRLAIEELRRVAKQRLIVVVPKQRPYQYTFDLHLHFFPYRHSLLGLMGTQKRHSCREVKGDWLYIEEVN